MTQGLYQGISTIPEFSLVLCDPLLGNSDYLDNLLMKPFQNFNKINVVYAPITSSVATNNITHLSQFLKLTKPSRFICSTRDYDLFQNLAGFDFPLEPELVVGSKFSIENTNFYHGWLPESIANQIEMTQIGPMAISRLDAKIVIKD